MKKRFIIISTMMIFVFIICIFEIVFINNISVSSKQLIAEMQNMYSENENADITGHADKLYNLWQNNIPLISALVQHSMIDEIEQTVAIIKSAAEHGDSETFQTEMVRATAQIQSLRDMEFPYIENIL